MCACLSGTSSFSYLIPPVNKKTPVIARQPRKDLLVFFQTIVASSAPHSCNLHSFLDDELKQRTSLQCGHPHVEFNVKVAFHPERGKLAFPDPLATDVNHWRGTGRSGLKLELIGHGSATTVLLPLSHLPYVQLYKKRGPGLPCLNPAYEYDRDWSSSTLDRQVAMDLDECTGDTTAMTQVLLGYYK